MTDPLTFLMEVWDEQPRGYRFYDAKTKKGGVWTTLHDGGKGEIELPNPKRHDCYFTPNTFSEPRRLNRFANSSIWLYADLDTADPTCPDFVVPTLCWETSPNKYQAMWRLTKRLSPAAHQKLNKAVTYITHADKGGWGLNKVLRIPGTYNHKYQFEWQVRESWDTDVEYDPKELAHLLADHDSGAPPSAGEIPKLSPVSPKAIRTILRKRGVPTSLRNKLKQVPRSTDDRSRILFKLEGELLRSGCTPKETLLVVRQSPWNKFSRHEDGGDRQLWTEIHRHREVNEPPKKVPKKKRATGTTTKVNGLPLPFDEFKDFVYKELPAPKWGIDSIWSDKAHGIIAGPAKSFKTLIALDMAVSVASGTKFLGHFDVPEQGPVLVIQAENTPGLIQDRITKIAHARGLVDSAKMVGDLLTFTTGKDLPIHFLNNHSMQLTEQEDFDKLSDTFSILKPRLVVFDPWYLLATGVDENSQREVAPILKGLKDLKDLHNTGMLLVHHFRKSKLDAEAEPDLERVSGTSVFGRWFQSALIVQPGEERNSAKITPYHREFEPQSTIQVNFDIGGYTSLEYECEVEITQAESHSLSSLIRDAVRDEPGVALNALASYLDMKPDRLRRKLDRTGYVIRKQRSKGKRGRPALGVWLPSE